VSCQRNLCWLQWDLQRRSASEIQVDKTAPTKARSYFWYKNAADAALYRSATEIETPQSSVAALRTLGKYFSTVAATASVDRLWARGSSGFANSELAPLAKVWSEDYGNPRVPAFPLQEQDRLGCVASNTVR
jgi:hypothetical protein